MTLSLNFPKLAHFPRQEHERISHQDRDVDQGKDQTEFHLSSRDAKTHLRFRTCADASTYETGLQSLQRQLQFYCTSRRKNFNALLCKSYKTKRPLFQGRFLKSTREGIIRVAPGRRECRRRESNPHSRREHDFESCASAYSATSATGMSFPMRPKVYHSQHEGQDKM